MPNPVPDMPVEMRELVAKAAAAQEWIRKPDWESDFSSADLAQWLNDRPTALYPQLSAAISTLSARVAALEAGLTIGELQQAHIVRQEEWCPEQKPDLSFRGNEMAGEVGEACNVIKKLERERHGWRGSRATTQELADELADVVHTALLCAITVGIELEPAVRAKFNATSDKNGLTSRLPEARRLLANGGAK